MEAMRLANQPTPEHLLVAMGEKPIEELIAETVAEKKRKPKYEFLGVELDPVTLRDRLCGSTAKACAASCLCLVLAAFLLILIAGSPPLPSGPTEEGAKLDAKTVFFLTEEVPDTIPRPPASYPENLLGVFWMDQWGYYAHSDLSGGYEDGLMSFGDTKYDMLNTETGDIFVSTDGPAWTWLNNPAGYEQYNTVARWGNYLFRWNADFTQARIYPSVHVGGRNYFGLGPTLSNLGMFFVQFWMTRQTPPLGSCPPKADATKEERAACATWRRDSCLLWCFGSWIGVNRQMTYYVFEVVDKHGKKIQPYFTEFQNFAFARSSPNLQAALEQNVTLGSIGRSRDATFHGEYVTPAVR